MVTVYRFHVYYKLQSKSGKLYRRKYSSVAFINIEICHAAFRSWCRWMREYYKDSGKYFQIMNYFMDSTIEELPVEDIYVLSDCKKIKEYEYAFEYWLPF